MESRDISSSTNCRSGCGFYGSPATDGLCSKCFKDALKLKNNPPGRLSPPSSISSGKAKLEDKIHRHGNPGPCSSGDIDRDRSNCGEPLKNVSASNINKGPSGCDLSSNNCASPNGNPGLGAGGVGATNTTTSTLPVPACSPLPSVASDASLASTTGSIGSSGENAPEIPGEATSPAGDPPQKKKPNRCVICKKKVGLTGFDCRCGGLFCGLHRYSDAHGCSFDYKTLGKEEIRKNNPLVKSEKVQKL